MSDRLKELIDLANRKALLDEWYEDDEWYAFGALDEKAQEQYCSKLSLEAQARFFRDLFERFIKGLGKSYKEKKIDFKTLESEVNQFIETWSDFIDLSETKTKKEIQYGYSWSFLLMCNRKLGISLRELERETGIGKDTINRYIKSLEHAMEL